MRVRKIPESLQTKYHFIYRREHDALLTEANLIEIDRLLKSAGYMPTLRYKVNCIKTRLEICIFCNCPDLVLIKAEDLLKAKSGMHHKYKCTNCLRSF